MRISYVKKIALSGMLAALSVTVMCVGGFIPLATYVCPMLCAIVCRLVVRLCGKKLACTWFFGVSLLCLLLCPDKEAASVFLFLGHYPIIKDKLDAVSLGWILKMLLFNLSAAIAYLFQVYVFGLDAVYRDLSWIGVAGLILFLIIANLTFFLLDAVLGRLFRKR